MADDDNADRSRLDWLDPTILDIPTAEPLDSLGGDLQGLIDGATPNPDDIETALSGVSLPDGTELDVDTQVLPNANLGGAEVDQVVETGGEVVEVAVEGGGEAGTVLVDTGGEVVEVAVEGGGEAAVEATGKLITAALESV
jgi:hypothetical protein